MMTQRESHGSIDFKSGLEPVLDQVLVREIENMITLQVRSNQCQALVSCSISLILDHSFR